MRKGGREFADFVLFHLYIKCTVRVEIDLATPSQTTRHLTNENNSFFRIPAPELCAIMSIQRCFLVLLIVFCSSDAFGKDRFSWEMFLPAISNQCRADSLVYCRGSMACQGRGGYWYEESCHAEPQPVCGVARLELCVTEPACSAAGGYWYEKTCHPEQSPDFINITKLAGDWYFNMNFGDPEEFFLTYSLDGGTVRENPVGSGTFTIEGTDKDHDLVTGRYVRESDDYTMYVSKTTANILYEFVFTSAIEVRGCYYEENKGDGTLGPCLPMWGQKL